MKSALIKRSRTAVPLPRLYLLPLVIFSIFLGPGLFSLGFLLEKGDAEAGVRPLNSDRFFSCGNRLFCFSSVYRERPLLSAHVTLIPVNDLVPSFDPTGIARSTVPWKKNYNKRNKADLKNKRATLGPRPCGIILFVPLPV